MPTYPPIFLSQMNNFQNCIPIFRWLLILHCLDTFLLLEVLWLVLNHTPVLLLNNSALTLLYTWNCAVSAGDWILSGRCGFGAWIRGPSEGHVTNTTRRALRHPDRHIFPPKRQLFPGSSNSNSKSFIGFCSALLRFLSWVIWNYEKIFFVHMKVLPQRELKSQH